MGKKGIAGIETGFQRVSQPGWEVACEEEMIQDRGWSIKAIGSRMWSLDCTQKQRMVTEGSEGIGVSSEASLRSPVVSLPCLSLLIYPTQSLHIPGVNTLEGGAQACVLSCFSRV